MKVLDFGKLISDEDNKINSDDEMIDARPMTVANENITKDYPDNVTSATSMIHNKNMRRNNILSKTALYKRYYKVLNKEGVARDLKREFKTAMITLKECYSQNEIKHTFLRINKKCSRRANIEIDFLKKFTSILNRYTNSIPFTEELTAVSIFL